MTSNYEGTNTLEFLTKIKIDDSVFFLMIVLLLGAVYYVI